MPKLKKLSSNSNPNSNSSKSSSNSKFRLDLATPAQKLAWAAFQQHDVLFLSGPAGAGKTFVAVGFAINEILQNKVKKIIITRPIVEAGESLGFLPGTLDEKVAPYLAPIQDSLTKLVGASGPQREYINSCIQVIPLAYMRGVTMDNAVCILDEAQNCSIVQFRLFLSRLGRNSKMIITGDPTQSDIGSNSGLNECVARLESVSGIGMIKFEDDHIVRHPLIASMMKALS